VKVCTAKGSNLYLESGSCVAWREETVELESEDSDEEKEGMASGRGLRSRYQGWWDESRNNGGVFIEVREVKFPVPVAKLVGQTFYPAT